MVASATLGKAQILESGLMLAYAAQACEFAAAWPLQVLESGLLLADAAQTWRLAAAQLVQILVFGICVVPQMY